MSQKVTITKNKINGLLESQVTQPTDGVPLSMLNDLSGSIAIDISNLETQIYDLSYYVYNDLSGGGGGAGEINIGTYTDTSTTIFPTITTLLFDASSFTLDLSGTSTIKIDIDVSGGSGEVTYSDLSYLLFDKPLISTDCSGYSTGSQNITVKWQPPSQTKAAFNFTTSSNTSADEYNYLPFINDLIIGYQVSGTSTWSDFTYSTDVTGSSGFAPVKVNQLDVTNTGSLPVTKSVTGTTGSNAKINLNLTSNAIGKSYQFRIAYTNNSEDTAWNYLYCPDPSYIPFGNPGPALAPTVLTINSTSYQELDVGGSGGQYMDSSLNLPWGGTIVKIGYGLDVSGQRSNNSVQVDGHSINQFTFDVSLGWWNGSNYNAQSWTTNQDNVAYPEYLYNSVANTYYAVNSAEDFSRTQVYYTGSNKADGVIIPSRSAVTNEYDKFLNGTLRC